MVIVQCNVIFSHPIRLHVAHGCVSTDTCFWNNEILTPIQKHGMAGPGKIAFKKLRILLDRMMLRRTKVLFFITIRESSALYLDTYRYNELTISGCHHARSSSVEITLVRRRRSSIYRSFPMPRGSFRPMSTRELCSTVSFTQSIATLVLTFHLDYSNIFSL